MTDPVVIPSMTAVPPFPALADRATNTYNSKAFAFGNHMSVTFNGQLTAVAEACRINAVAASERAVTAAAQATIATNKAAAAAQSVIDAAAQVTLATTQANNASTSAATAAARLADVEALYDQFDDRYLGAKASDPTLDNDGNPLQNGAFYINTVSGYLRAYTIAGGWVQGISAVAGVSSFNGQTGAVTGVSSVNGQTGVVTVAVPVGATLFTALNAGAL